MLAATCKAVATFKATEAAASVKMLLCVPNNRILTEAVERNREVISHKYA